VRPLIFRPAALGALTVFAFLSFGTFGQALGVDVAVTTGAGTVATTATSATCALVPKNVVLAKPATTNRTTAASTSASVSPSDTGSPSVSSSPSTSPSASPSTSVTPSDSATTTPSTSPSSSISAAASSPTPTPSPSPSPTPTPTPTPQLCVRVQSYATSQVAPGSYANFVIWVWSEQAPSTSVVVTTKVLNATDLGSPAFIVCPASSGTTCTLGDLPVDQADELESMVEVPATATVGEQWQLSATASAPLSSSYSGTATDVVTATAPTPTPTPTPITSPTTPAPTPTASSTLAPIAGTSVSPTNPSSLFPTVGASPTTGTGSLNLPPAKARSALHADTAAADVPLDARLLGGQIAGLAVLAGAIAIAIARLSLRRQKAAGDPNAPKPPEQ
jgi:hypothetical protein